MTGLAPRKCSTRRERNARDGVVRWIAVAPIGFAACILGCGGAPGAAGEEPTATASQPIYGGTIDDDAHANPAVIALRVDRDAQSFELCSGALIAPNVVLTAHHCVGSNVATSVGCDSNGLSTSGAQVGPDLPTPSLHVFVGAHPDTQFGTPDANVTAIYDVGGPALCNADLALVVLDRALTAISPLSVRLSAATRAGESVRAVGYGQNDINAPTGTRVRRDGVTVLAVGAGVSKSGTPLGANELELGESTCVGDSGGPAISEQTGAVVGVVSRAGSCSDDFGHVYTMASAFAELITRVLAMAGQQPLSEVVPTDGGASPASAGPAVPPPTGGPSVPPPEADAGVSAGAPRAPIVDVQGRSMGCTAARRSADASAWAPVLALLGAAFARRGASRQVSKRLRRGGHRRLMELFVRARGAALRHREDRRDARREDRRAR